MIEDQVQAAVVEATPAPEEKQKKAKPLAIVQKSLSEFEKVSAGIAALQRKYDKVVYAVGTTKGMEDAKKARLDIRNVRYAVQNAMGAATKELNTIKDDVKLRGEQIIEPLTALEKPIDDQIKAEENRKAEEKRLKEEAELARTAAIHARLNQFTDALARATGGTSQEIGAILDEVAAIQIDNEWEEFTTQAADAKDQAVSRLITLKARALATEEVQAALAAEREAIERERAEIARQRQELEEARNAAQAARIAEQQAVSDAARRVADEEAAAAAAEAELAKQTQEDVFFDEPVDVYTPPAPVSGPALVNPELLAHIMRNVEPVRQPHVNVELPMDLPLPELDTKPSDLEIVQAVADRFDIGLELALQWISEISFGSVSNQIAEAA